MSDDLPATADIEKCCPKCGDKMVQGFVVDNNHGGFHVASWIRGAPQRSFWWRTKVDRKNAIPIGTFRCSACGFLESYADREFGAR